MDPTTIEAGYSSQIADLNRNISELSIQKKKYFIGMAIAATTLTVAALALVVFGLISTLAPPLVVPIAAGTAVVSMILVGIFITQVSGSHGERYRKREELEYLTQYMSTLKSTSPFLELTVAANMTAMEEPNNTSSNLMECNITSEIPKNPVFLNGRLYDREAIAKWLIKNGTDPFTRSAVSDKQLYAFKTAQEFEPKCPITKKSYDQPYFSPETGYCYERSAIEALSIDERRKLLNIYDKKIHHLAFLV